MKQYIVDAFTDRVFRGNQAAVCVMEKWLPEDLMMNITRENNFSETAFTVRGKNGYDLRWFTPGGEIDLCGHATLAAAFVLFSEYEQEAENVVFHTLSGDLPVCRRDGRIVMDFPAYRCGPVPVTPVMAEATGHAPKEAYLDRDLLLVYEDEEIVRRMAPDFEKLARLDGMGTAVTAPGREADCVSRFFAPKLKISEDPVTGSVHCMIAPYWAARLGKTRIRAHQASERGGDLLCELRGDRVAVAGKAALYAVCDLKIFGG